MRSAPPTSPLLDALAERVLVFDGAMGTSLQAAQPTAAQFGGEANMGWIDGLVLHSPDLVAAVHRDFLRAGCDVVETCTFQASGLRMREWGAAAKVVELNRSAARLARQACQEFNTTAQPRFVAGSMGPSGFLPSTDDPALGAADFGTLQNNFREQAIGLLDGEVDLLIIETCQDILEVKAAVFGAREAFAECQRQVPIHVSVSLDTTGRMLLGTDISAVVAILCGLGVDIIGLNCSTGPDYMHDAIRYLTEHSPVPIACIPNAGLPINQEGVAHYPMTAAAMARELIAFMQLGVEMIGGCCGTTPEHISALVAAAREIKPKARRVLPRPQLSSAMRATDLEQEPRPLLIGERLNAQGSKAAKRYLMGDDYDSLVTLGRQQQEHGAHALDICVALTERADEAAQMVATAAKLQRAVDCPLVFDSTDPAVLKAALEAYPGRGVVNSVNLENGRERCDAVLPLVRDHGCAVIALVIDEAGMALETGRKVEIAQRIADLAYHEFRLSPDQLIFDALTFTLATGEEQWRHSAIATLEGLAAIKAALPGVHTVLGVSNVSFGLAPAARAVLNGAFLHHAVAAGLDMAIVNPAHAVPYQEMEEKTKVLADDLIFARDQEALSHFIEHFLDTKVAVAATADRFAGMEPAERIFAQITQRHGEGIEEQIDLELGRGRDAVEILNEVLLPAMKDVGDRFGAGELILPYVLQSAEVMKRAVAHLEQYLEKREGYAKGTVVLATVYGDVHDIGKNLVHTILANNGYTVHDLGKQVPLNTIIEKAVEVHADAIGLSALLVSTSRQMPLCVAELAARGLTFPLLIGGAAINRNFGRRILYLEDGRAYDPGVFYCNDAFEGLSTVDQLLDAQKRPLLQQRIAEEADKHRQLVAHKGQRDRASDEGEPLRPQPNLDIAPVPEPPFWGSRVLKTIVIDDVVPHIDRNSLFKMSWQFRGIHDPEVWNRLLRDELEPRLERSIGEAKREGWLELEAVYGYWPALRVDDSVIIFDPDDVDRELGRFNFPRQRAQSHLCLADYVRSASQLPAGQRDVVALQVVTTGPRPSLLSNSLQEKGRYDDMLRIHGFATQMAEATAEWLHQRIRNELSLGPGQGRRYSWGYPACPELEDHRTLFSILPASEIGVGLTSAWQLVPEQSTAAIVMHHPQARYFAVYTVSEGLAESRAGNA